MVRARRHYEIDFVNLADRGSSTSTCVACRQHGAEQAPLMASMPGGGMKGHPHDTLVRPEDEQEDFMRVSPTRR